MMKMFKFWLTCSQPSLGFLGIALLLSAPFAASAAPTATTTAATKTAKPQSVASNLGTTIDRELQSIAIPGTPDLAVRQLAINSMMMSGAKGSSVAVQAPQIKDTGIASFLPSTAKLQNLSARATIKPQVVQHSVASAVATKSLQATAAVVPGLFIGTSNVRVSNDVLPGVPTMERTQTAKLIAAPNPTASMLALASVADPFPVVLPEGMQGLKLNTQMANVPKTQPAVKSVDPIAAIPAALQRLLGNEPSRPTAVATAPVAKAIGGSSTNSLLALSQLITPGAATPTVTASARGASLQLNTAQAYASVPKFDIPGVGVSASVPAPQIQAAKPVAKIQTVAPAQKNMTIATANSKSNYAALMSNRLLVSAPKPFWATVSQSNNLGGLILGSQHSTTAHTIALLPQTVSTKLTAFNPTSVN